MRVCPVVRIPPDIRNSQNDCQDWRQKTFYSDAQHKRLQTDDVSPRGDLFSLPGSGGASAMTTTIPRVPRRRFHPMRDYSFAGIVLALAVSTHWGNYQHFPQRADGALWLSSALMCPCSMEHCADPGSALLAIPGSYTWLPLAEAHCGPAWGRGLCPSRGALGAGRILMGRVSGAQGETLPVSFGAVMRWTMGEVLVASP